MANIIDIKGLSKAKLLAALYNKATLVVKNAAKHGIMTEEEAQKIIESGHTDFSYVYGKAMKINLTEDIIDSWGYDRDNGDGVVAKIVRQVREEKDNPQKKTSKSDEFVDRFFSDKEEQIPIKGKEYKVATIVPDGLDCWLSTMKFRAQLVKNNNKPGMDGYEFAEPPNVFRLIIEEGEDEKKVIDWIENNDMGSIVK